MSNLEIIKSMDVEKIKIVFKRPEFAVEQAAAIAEYKVADHAIFDTTIRPVKKITKGTGETDADGKEKTTVGYIEPARIGMSFQQLIVDRRVGFMLTIPVETDAIYESESDKEKALVKMVDRIQNDNKMDYRNKEIARRWMSEMECAECWYFVETPDKKTNDERRKAGIKSGEILPASHNLKCNIWSPDLGDTLYPLFSPTGDMIAFARGYKLKEEDKDIEHFDVYTSEFEYKYVDRDNTWKLDDTLTNPDGTKKLNPLPNSVKKIMIVYHSQNKPEWADQGSMITRLETSISNHADMNDYFGSPILAVFGEIMGFAAKGEQGKILQFNEQAKANYLALNSPPESIKMEQENLEKFIFALSQTPNITFEQMMKIGPVSGVAMKMMFLDAHMSVSRKEETFGIGLQRRLNILKAAIGTVIDISLAAEAKSLQLKPIITPYLPLNVTEMVENLSVSTSSGIMSKETAVEQNPLVEDSETEMERLRTDATNDLAGTENLPIKGKNTTASKTGA